MAARDSWPSIMKHGLLSTSALLDLFEIDGEARKRIEERHRPRTEVIAHKRHGNASIRDQKPMSDRGLKRALRDGLSPRDWYLMLNSKVFFWTSEERLHRLLCARAYASDEHDVLIIGSKPLIRAYACEIVLCPMNSGATTPFAHPRGADTFLDITSYPWAEWKKKRGRREAVVELAVRGGVPDVVKYVTKVLRMKQRKVIKTLFEE